MTPQFIQMLNMLYIYYIYTHAYNAQGGLNKPLPIFFRALLRSSFLALYGFEIVGIST